ncbi:hypothetical protein C4573_07145 [Candidatus Woesearchaeota archaeon]|nr:MAG: hypothetical protein C4573_07145 [Candidatus Woesearchaeota archaeon]
MARCTFCGMLIEKGTGLMYVKTDATIFHFCSRKCEKNLLKLQRKPRETTWTVDYKKAKKEAEAAKHDAKEKRDAKKLKHDADEKTEKKTEAIKTQKNDSKKTAEKTEKKKTEKSAEKNNKTPKK